MRDYLFYNAGCLEVHGIYRLAVPFRRLLRRILLPFFQRLVALLQDVDKDLEQLAERQRNVEALHLECDAQARQLGEEFKALTRRQANLEAVHLDHDALVRRLAVLEDHVESLLRAADDQTVAARLHTSTL
jgi:hypothetical protein